MNLSTKNYIPFPKVESILKESAIRMTKKTILFLSFLFTLGICHGQGFKAGVVLGGNMSQINGDLIAGFNKLGVQGGLKVMRDVSERMTWSLELLYSEKGSRSTSRDLDPLKIKINYVEFPLTISWKDWLADEYYKLWFEGGVSVGSLISSKIEDVGGLVPVDEFRKTDISWLLGATFFSQEKTGFFATICSVGKSTRRSG